MAALPLLTKTKHILWIQQSNYRNRQFLFSKIKQNQGRPIYIYSPEAFFFLSGMSLKEKCKSGSEWLNYVYVLIIYGEDSKILVHMFSSSFPLELFLDICFPEFWDGEYPNMSNLYKCRSIALSFSHGLS